MSLWQLTICDLRCIAAAELEFDPRCNLVSGANASGKTSLLEAIFFLGRGRSFRTSRTESLIRRGSGEVMVTGRLATASGGQTPVGIRYSRDGFEARAGAERLHSLAELATVMPVQAIDPEVHRLVEGGPQERRRFLDWGVFHVKPGFVEHWRRYQRALKQRNAALRAGSPERVVRTWDRELVESGTVLAASRRTYFEALRPAVARAGELLLGAPVELSLANGWLAGSELPAALDLSWGRDRDGATTHVGPHRADLAIRLGDESARHWVSRGQQKLTAAAMLLGQLQCDAALGSPTSALLVDDPAAELDSSNLDRLITVITALPAQLFVTALDPSLPAFGGLPKTRRFHVEHGKISRLI